MEPKLYQSRARTCGKKKKKKRKMTYQCLKCPISLDDFMGVVIIWKENNKKGGKILQMDLFHVLWFQF